MYWRAVAGLCPWQQNWLRKKNSVTCCQLQAAGSKAFWDQRPTFLSLQNDPDSMSETHLSIPGLKKQRHFFNKMFIFLKKGKFVQIFTPWHFQEKEDDFEHNINQRLTCEMKALYRFRLRTSLTGNPRVLIERKMRGLEGLFLFTTCKFTQRTAVELQTKARQLLTGSRASSPNTDSMLSPSEQMDIGINLRKPLELS